ncbi:MAG: dihydropteroate synthase [Acidobacteriota bacterium]
MTIRKEYLLSLPNRTLLLGRRTLVMGILNVTPDSFSDAGKYLQTDLAIARALAIESEGADILDIGGESTRPGADPISAEDEIARVLPVIEALHGQLHIPISIDTCKSSVAAAALAAGAEIINDISGFSFDREIAKVAARSGAACCLMHMRGTPKVMQQLPPSPNIWADIIDVLSAAVIHAEQAGVAREQIILDPGIGFGKTVQDNLAILAKLSRLHKLDLPVLIGTSRKSFIGKLLENAVKDRLMGTAATVAVSILNGAHIVRVHDVAPMVEVVRVTDAILASMRE